jgi:hypothetical protein
LRCLAIKTYDFNKQYDVSKIAIDRVSHYLFSLEETIDVMNVEDDKAFQEFDIDLIHITNRNVVNIEVKSDTYESGNFFFETISNATKGTQGCFMYTCADYLHYYFVKSSTIYILPMPSTREWFIKNMDRFDKKKLATRSGNKVLYHSYGYAVPIEIVRKEVKGIKEVVII